MQDYYDRLGLSPGATPAEIKAAYHAKLKEFPAHSHPEDFKAIRAAYEALRKGPQREDDFFAEVPVQAELDPALIEQLRQRASVAVDVTFDDLIRLTF
ncbi:DnaJ domain-containing protein [Nodosilinea sp. LEGE 07088]|uniref:DnaJ domain-containing protein n=1 Tax=Nodosilinea sp. LEGE 07088 TaxID=2777968 RepID=UPI00188183B7|nr:DnaJ domain-containing protein [Nodosilinea sp. LEGE 07088]MBE9137874.1 DnaJ domain-containing protein [Nodosilinea sp. LEGE 07088]